MGRPVLGAPRSSSAEFMHRSPRHSRAGIELRRTKSTLIPAFMSSAPYGAHDTASINAGLVGPLEGGHPAWCGVPPPPYVRSTGSQRSSTRKAYRAVDSVSIACSGTAQVRNLNPLAGLWTPGEANLKVAGVRLPVNRHRAPGRPLSARIPHRRSQRGQIAAFLVEQRTIPGQGDTPCPKSARHRPGPLPDRSDAEPRR